MKTESTKLDKNKVYFKYGKEALKAIKKWTPLTYRSDTKQFYRVQLRYDKKHNKWNMKIQNNMDITGYQWKTWTNFDIYDPTIESDTEWTTENI